jgi:hypothetical protein
MLSKQFSEGSSPTFRENVLQKFKLSFRQLKFLHATRLNGSKAKQKKNEDDDDVDFLRILVSLCE